MISRDIVDGLTDLAKLYSEIVKQISIGRVDPLDALGGCRRILWGQKEQRYDSFLLSLYEQIRKLRDLNQKMPNDLRIDDFLIAQINDASSYIQKLTDLQSLVVVHNTLKDTIRYQIELLNMQYSKYSFNVKLRDEDLDMFEFNDLADKHMKCPGVYITRTNILAYSNSSRKHSEIEEDIRKNENLCGGGIATIAAYALQDPRLLGRYFGRGQIPHNCDSLNFLPTFSIPEISGPGRLRLQCKILVDVVDWDNNSPLHPEFERQMCFSITDDSNKPYYSAVPTMIY